MKKMSLSMVLCVPLLLTACASTVKPQYVSPVQYQSLSCAQLQSEYTRIQNYIDRGVENTSARSGVGLGVGLSGGWGSRGGWGLVPNISVNMGQSSNSKNSELSRVLGEQEAIVQAANFSQCPIVIRKK